MKCRVTTLGGYKDYGESKVVADLDDLGPIKLHEMEIASPQEIAHLLDEDMVNSVEFEPEKMSGYDAHLTVVCDEVL